MNIQVKLTNYNNNLIFELKKHNCENTTKNFKLTFFEKLLFAKHDKKLAEVFAFCLENADFFKVYQLATQST